MAINLPWDHVMSHKKFGPDRFSRFDVYWIQTDKQTNRQTDRQAKFIYRYIVHPTIINWIILSLDFILHVESAQHRFKYTQGCVWFLHRLMNTMLAYRGSKISSFSDKSIYQFGLSVWVSVCLFVCLYPINVKTAEPIGPKFFVGHHVIPGKVYESKKV